MSKQKFIDKFFAAFFILAAIKIIVLLMQLSYQSLWSVMGQIMIFLFVAFVLMMILSALGSGSFSFGNNNNGGGTAYLESSMFDKVRNRYEELAQKYIEEKDYKSAAQVYMKLLQDNYKSAKTLEDGKLYSEAAVVYLKKCFNKEQAAICYEHAMDYKKAIDLYREQNQKEKVGDLYLKINDKENAHKYFQMVVDDYVENRQMVKASLIFRKKMEEPEKAQDYLLKGWHEKWDAFNCMNNYFANISDINQLQKEVQTQYHKASDDSKRMYLDLMKHEFKKDPKMETITRNIAYEIVAQEVKKHHGIVSELKFFNPYDDNVLKDILRYKSQRNKIIK